jgi:hypothetical protein
MTATAKNLEALNHAPHLVRSSQSQRAVRPTQPSELGGPVWTVGDFAAQLGITTVQLAERAYASEVPR